MELEKRILVTFKPSEILSKYSSDEWIKFIDKFIKDYGLPPSVSGYVMRKHLKKTMADSDLRGIATIAMMINKMIPHFRSISTQALITLLQIWEEYIEDPCAKGQCYVRPLKRIIESQVHSELGTYPVENHWNATQNWIPSTLKQIKEKKPEIQLMSV